MSDTCMLDCVLLTIMYRASTTLAVKIHTIVRINAQIIKFSPVLLLNYDYTPSTIITVWLVT